MSSRYPRALALHVSCAEQTWAAAGVGKSHRQDPKGQNVGGDRVDHAGTRSQKMGECGVDTGIFQIRGNGQKIEGKGIEK